MANWSDLHDFLLIFLIYYRTMTHLLENNNILWNKNICHNWPNAADGVRSVQNCGPRRQIYRHCASFTRLAISSRAHLSGAPSLTFLFNSAVCKSHANIRHFHSFRKLYQERPQYNVAINKIRPRARYYLWRDIL